MKWAYGPQEFDWKVVIVKVSRITQLFLQFARALPEPGMPEGAERGATQVLRGPLLIRDGLVMRDELALSYIETLEEMYDLASKDGSWNKSAVDDLLAKHLLAVARAEASDRPNVIKAQAAEFEATLKAKLTTWEMDLSIFGMANDCAGLSFGKLSFMTDVVKSPIQIPGILDPGVNTLVLFARVRVEAIDRKSATDRACEIVDHHLAVLNALCSDLVPSRTNLARTNVASRRFAVHRMLPVSGPKSLPPEERELRGTAEGPAVLLSRADYEAFLKRRGGSRMSSLLEGNSSFAGRLVSAFETAGAASVETKPQLSFLLFAIALESVVLGRDTQSEITYQLSARVAHLLAADLKSRKTIVKRVADLYGLRSKIVHAGSTDVSDAEVESIREVCLSTLFALATLPAFVNMTSVDELEGWFKDRMLGAPDPLEREVTG
jgi:hypothetical protein